MPRWRVRTVVVGLVTVLSLGVFTPFARATTGDITEFMIPTAASLPQGIRVGSDGALWFAERSANAIGRLANGSFTEYPLPTANSAPFWVTAGPDGNVWFTERSGNRIGSITPAGAITEYPIPTASSQPAGITTGPDGALWFAEQASNRIGRITTAGAITEFPLPHASSGPFGITTGPDSALWFTEQTGNRIGRITTAGAITEFTFIFSNRQPSDITVGADGKLWFTERGGNAIGRISTGGSIDEFVVPTPLPNVLGIAAGPDGNVWFTEIGGNNIGRITPDGTITEFPLPIPVSQPFAIALGSDGAMWFTEAAGNRIGRLEVQPAPPPDTTPPTVTITSPADGSVFSVGQVVLADYGCADEVGGSGVATCDGPVANGGSIDTSLGTHTFSVTATDLDGNQTVGTTSYAVLGDLGGPLIPVPAWNDATAGSALPVSFDMGPAAAGAAASQQEPRRGKPEGPGSEALAALFAAGFPVTQEVSCDDPATVIGPAETPNVDVQVNKDGRFHLVWKSEESWAGSCRTLILRFDVAGWRDAAVMFLVRFR